MTYTCICIYGVYVYTRIWLESKCIYTDLFIYTDLLLYYLNLRFKCLAFTSGSSSSLESVSESVSGCQSCLSSTQSSKSVSHWPFKRIASCRSAKWTMTNLRARWQPWCWLVRAGQSVTLVGDDGTKCRCRGRPAGEPAGSRL